MRALVVALVAVAACAAQPPPPAPPPLPVATAAPAPTQTAAPIEPAPIAFVPKAPFSIVARAPGSELLGVLPLEDGAAILFAKGLSGGGPMRAAVLDHDTITPVSNLAAGFPETINSTTDPPLAAGRWPDDVWRAHGTPCQAERWENGAWKTQPPSAPVNGPCMKLAAWTPGAAIAVVDAPDGLALRAFGRAPRVVPANPPAPRAEAKRCPSLFSVVHALFAWPAGEVVAAGATCTGTTWIARWPRNAARAATLEAGIDPNGPYLVRAFSSEDLQIDGGGVLPGDPSGEVSVRARFQLAGKALRRTSIVAHDVNALEQWMVQGKALLGLPEDDPTDGFVYEGYRLTTSDDVFAFGRIVRQGKLVESVVLRNRPVKQPFVFP